MRFDLILRYQESWLSCRKSPCWCELRPVVLHGKRLCNIRMCLGTPLSVRHARIMTFACVYRVRPQDVLMDWSLCKPHAQYPLLRPELIFKTQIPVRYSRLYFPVSYHTLNVLCLALSSLTTLLWYGHLPLSDDMISHWTMETRPPPPLCCRYPIYAFDLCG